MGMEIIWTFPHSDSVLVFGIPIPHFSRIGKNDADKHYLILLLSDIEAVSRSYDSLPVPLPKSCIKEGNDSM